MNQICSQQTRKYGPSKTIWNHNLNWCAAIIGTYYFQSLESNQQPSSLRTDTTRTLHRPTASNPIKKANMSQTWSATGWIESAIPSAYHCKVTVRHLESVQKPQEEVARRCSPIRENARVSARCQHQSARQVLQVVRRVPNSPCKSNLTRRQVKQAVCCAKMPAWSSEVTHHLFSIEYHPVVFTPHRHSPLLQTHASQRGMYVLIYVERIWDAKLHRDHFWLLSSSQQHI